MTYSFSSRLRRTALQLAMLSLAASGGALPAAWAQADTEAVARQREQARLADMDTLLALSNDGAVLYAQDKLKLSGFQYCSQAVALAEAGEFRQSVRAASKALHLAQATRDPALNAVAKRDLAIVYSYSGQLEKAEQFAREALALQAQVREPQQIVGPANKVLGDVAVRRRDYAGALVNYRDALAGSSDRYAPLVRVSMANALIESGKESDLVAARELLAQIPVQREAALQAQLERSRANLLLAEKKHEQARDAFAALAAKRSGSDSAYYRLWAWDGVARSEQALGNGAAAAQAMDQAIQSMDQVRSRFRSDEIKMGLFSDMQTIFERAIDAAVTDGNAARAFEISERSRSRALLDAMRGHASAGDSLGSVMALSAMQGALKSDERIVVFHSLPTRIAVWVIGPQDIRMLPVAVTRDELVDLVDTYRNSVVRGNRSAIGNGDKLGAALIAPLGLQGGQRLTVVPHGALHYLPFQALRTDGRFLIETHPMSVAPSASIAMQLAQRSQTVPSDLTAFGNPRIEDKYDLPGSEAEVKKLAGMFSRKELFLGERATKTQFRQVSSRSAIMHVAAHAEADQVDPLYSRILLANEGGEQRFLEAHEVLDMRLEGTALVTLSACESGLGRIAQGDEVLGFTRSFLSAGSSSLIVSLWPVSDDATEVLMTTLYGELIRGNDVQKSVQAAQIAVLKQPKLAHPFFWAPFNLIGDWRLKLKAGGA
ncbi:CHAT domain-containing protein [Diaphorobacter aerolatus]|uniref:CHAT domain-containing protein n=1 Tax=Diaphorobacter aerolatus TaxID=1288495 RepID=A0A7H0GLK7_9BURK|nr:CHAT domain-containing protein [Diaphorobacter aerolatus]QNP49173.1 CHAT domain-containing protein [Diaphorobacter aerolatus]